MIQLPSDLPALFKGRHFDRLLITQAVRWYITCVDETYIRVRGRWTYLYRAVDKQGQVCGTLASLG